MIESMLFQRGEPGGGKKKFLSPVLIFLNMLCLREMVEKYYLEFYRIFIGAPPFLGLNYSILKQINLWEVLNITQLI
jgi:hypothetical protein